ncbi:MAG: IS1 family transposase, partial [Spirochaetaceae bacterium]|nr:IS1 family transposase [Spirochaetaceae bacterium]
MLEPVTCPHCGSGNIKRNGTAKNGKQRFLCCNEQCAHRTFVEKYTYNACEPTTRARIFFSIINGSGTRATARTLGIAKDTVTSTLRGMESLLWYINYDYIKARQTSSITVDMVSLNENEAEMDGTWNFPGGDYRLWWAVDHNTGEPAAFHFGVKEQNNLDALLALLKPFGITVVHSGDNFAYKSRGAEDEAAARGQDAQKIERDRASLRTWCSRLAR